MKRTAGVVLLFGLVAAACGGGKSGSTGATVPVASSTTSTSIDVSKVPDVITIAYANAVMKALDHVLGDAIRELVAKKVPTQHFADLLQAVYGEPSLSHQQSVYGQIAAQGMAGIKDPAGDPVTRVDRIEGSTSTCVVLSVTRDFSAALTEPKAAAQRGFITLAARGSGEPTGPTAWSITFDGQTTDGSMPRC